MNGVSALLKSLWLGFAVCIAMMPTAVAQAPPSSSGQPEQLGPKLVGWQGVMPFRGEFRASPSLNFDGSNLSFQIGQTQPFDGSIQIQVWLGEDGEPRIKIGDCVSVLVPAARGVTFQSGGAFRADAARAGTPPNCGLSPGETIERWTNTLTPTADGIRYVYSSVNKISQPQAGTSTIQGEALLQPVYRQPPRVMARTGAVEGAPQPSGVNFAEWVRFYGVERSLDAVLQLDSQNWLMNRYDHGSVTNGTIVARARDGTPSVLRGDYEYNGGSRGWIQVRLQRGELQCMEFWDFPGQCRPPGSMSGGSQLAIGALVGALTSSGGGSDSSDGLTDKQRALRDNDEWLSRQSGCRQWSC